VREDVKLPTPGGADNGVRPLRPADVPALLALARETIPDTMAARLGPRFAERYHRALLDEPSIRLDGYFADGELVGYIVYAPDAAAALRAAFARNRLTFATATLFSLLSRKRLAYVVRLAATVLARLPEPAAAVRSEVLTIAVRRSARGGGALRLEKQVNVPRALMEGAFEYLRAQGVSEIKAFCKPEELDPSANGFVQKSGFELQGRVTRWGMEANLYLKRLGPVTGDSRS
jgi:GNAT superfamily N-acetyltransferase